MATRVNALERALRIRNRLLEERRRDRAWLDAVEREIAETRRRGRRRARRETVERLAALIAAGRDDASPFPWADARAGGRDRSRLVGDAPGARGRRPLPRPAARRAARATAPPGARWSGRRPAISWCATARSECRPRRASTGEQKALLVGLVLAHARLVAAMSGIAPLVLLDEIAAHLDPAPPRRAVRRRSTALGGQVWMTGADPALFADLPDRRTFLVASGRVETLRSSLRD